MFWFLLLVHAISPHMTAICFTGNNWEEIWQQALCTWNFANGNQLYFSHTVDPININSVPIRFHRFEHYGHLGLWGVTGNGLLQRTHSSQWLAKNYRRMCSDIELLAIPDNCKHPMLKDQIFSYWVTVRKFCLGFAWFSSATMLAAVIKGKYSWVAHKATIK